MIVVDLGIFIFAYLALFLVLIFTFWIYFNFLNTKYPKENRSALPTCRSCGMQFSAPLDPVPPPVVVCPRCGCGVETARKPRSMV